jgi:DNA-binding beta-propeller fold protein YncE
MQGVPMRVIPTPGLRSTCNGVAVTADGASLLVSDYSGGSHSVVQFDVHTGARRRVVGGPYAGSRPGRFKRPCQVYVAADGCVFVAEYNNRRVTMLSPQLDFVAFVGADELVFPIGVCASDAVVAVSEYDRHRVAVFDRDTGALLRRFGELGKGDGQLDHPSGMCMLSDGAHLAVADAHNHRVCVFGVAGGFVRHIGRDVLIYPRGVASTPANELCIADRGNACVRLFSEAGEQLRVFGCGSIRGVAVSGGTVFVQDYDGQRCTLFE